jgi:P4 family phage/plasmid primase-like protien
MNVHRFQQGAPGGQASPQEEVSTFLNRLGRGGTWQNLWWKDGEESGTVWFPVGQVPDVSEYLHKEAVYFSVNPRRENLGSYKRGGNEDVDVINAVYADLDMNKGWTLEKIEALCPEPSVIKFTGGGWQPYWFLKEPIKVTKDSWEELNGFQHAWVEYIGGDAGAQDIARVLRVPYTFNNKPEYGKPIQVEIIKADYNLEYGLVYLMCLVSLKADRKARTASPSVDITTNPEVKERVLEAIKYLDRSRADKYETWLEIAMALHDGFRGSDEGYLILDNWSRQGRGYDPDENWKTWQDGFKLERDNKITIKTLFFHARKDSKGAYNGYASGNLLMDDGSLTDSGNAKRLAELYGDQMRYNKSLGWVIWDGKKWNIDDPSRAIKFAEDAVKSIFAEAASIADSFMRSKVLKHANQSLNLNRLRGMLGVAESKLYTDKETFDDNHKWLLNVENGILNLKTRELMLHDSKYMMTKTAGTRYDPDADAPQWKKFIEMIYPDPEMRRYVQKSVGYSLTGNSDERAIYFLEGKDGNNGKSTFVNTLAEMFGEYAASTDIQVITSAGKAASPMNEAFYNARFVYTNEVKANSTLSTTDVKALTGDDPIQCNPKFRKPYSFQPTHHLWIFGNNRPAPDNPNDEAFWDRLKRIKFDKKIPADIRRPQEEVKKEFRAERPGILNWALEGLHLWIKEGWQVPQALLDAVEEYREEYDLLAQFIEARIVLEEGAKLEKSWFVGEYNRFRVQEGESELGISKITRELKDKYGVEAGGNGKKYYVGIRYRTQEDDKQEEPALEPTFLPRHNPFSGLAMPSDNDEEAEETISIIDGVVYRDDEKGNMIEVIGQEAEEILAEIRRNGHR